jgi:hypothetical protein
MLAPYRKTEGLEEHQSQRPPEILISKATRMTAFPISGHHLEKYVAEFFNSKGGFLFPVVCP